MSWIISIKLLLLICVTYSYAEQNNVQREKRTFQYIKEAFKNKFTSNDNNLTNSDSITPPPPPLIVKESPDTYKAYLPEGYKVIDIIRNPEIDERLAEKTIWPPTLLRSYLRTQSPQETFRALLGLKNLIRSGILDTSQDNVDIAYPHQSPHIGLELPALSKHGEIYSFEAPKKIPYRYSPVSGHLFATYGVPSGRPNSNNVESEVFRVPALTTFVEKPVKYSPAGYQYSYKHINADGSITSYNNNNVKVINNPMPVKSSTWRPDTIFSADLNAPVKDASDFLLNFPAYVIPAVAGPPRTSYDVPLPESFVITDNVPTKLIQEIPILPYHLLQQNGNDVTQLKEIQTVQSLPKVQIEEFIKFVNQQLPISDNGLGFSQTGSYNKKVEGNSATTDVSKIRNVYERIFKADSFRDNNRYTLPKISSPHAFAQKLPVSKTYFSENIKPIPNPYLSTVDVYVNTPKNVVVEQNVPFVYRFEQRGGNRYQISTRGNQNTLIYEQDANTATKPQENIFVTSYLLPKTLPTPLFDNNQSQEFTAYKTIKTSDHPQADKSIGSYLLPNKINSVKFDNRKQETVTSVLESYLKHGNFKDQDKINNLNKGSTTFRNNDYIYIQTSTKNLNNSDFFAKQQTRKLNGNSYEINTKPSVLYNYVNRQDGKSNITVNSRGDVEVFIENKDPIEETTAQHIISLQEKPIVVPETNQHYSFKRDSDVSATQETDINNVAFENTVLESHRGDIP